MCDNLYLRVQSVRNKLSLCVTNIYEYRACAFGARTKIIFVSGKYLLVQSVCDKLYLRVRIIYECGACVTNYLCVCDKYL